MSNTGEGTATVPDSGPVPADGVLRPRSGGGQVAALPTPTVQCHAANLHRLPTGDLACVWFGGTQEGVSDIRVHLSRLPRGADRWLDPEVLSDDPARSEQNPILFTAPDGAVWLLWTAQRAGSQDTAEVRRRVSHDGGVTWASPEVMLPAQDGRGMFVRQPPVALPDGRLLLGTFNCLTPPVGRWVGDLDTSSVWESSDGGSTWSDVPVPDSRGGVHLGVVPRQDGSLWGYMRSRWADHVYETSSEDGGRTWASARATSLPNNNSSVQATALGDGAIALVYNHASVLDATGRRESLYDEIDDDGGLGAEESTEAPSPATDPASEGVADGSHPDESGPRAYWGAPRAPLSLALSIDDARTWPVRVDLETGDGYCLSNNSRDAVNRELSYPSVMVDDDGSVHVAYTWHRSVIKHVHLPAVFIASLRDSARELGGDGGLPVEIGDPSRAGT